MFLHSLGTSGEPGTSPFRCWAGSQPPRRRQMQAGGVMGGWDEGGYEFPLIFLSFLDIFDDFPLGRSYVNIEIQCPSSARPLVTSANTRSAPPPTPSIDLIANNIFTIVRTHGRLVFHTVDQTAYKILPLDFSD